MATKSSGTLSYGSIYTLGEYAFRLDRRPVTGSSNDQITAICTHKGKNARKSIQIPSSAKITGWNIEANDTTADVYIGVELQGPYIDPIPVPVPHGTGGGSISSADATVISSAPYVAHISGSSSAYFTILYASETPTTAHTSGHNWDGSNIDHTYNVTSSYTYNGKTVYYGTAGGTDQTWHTPPTVAAAPQLLPRSSNLGAIAWMIVYGGELEDDTKLVGRFPIELEDAGGVGPGSDWTDPGDYDDDRDPEDPTTTLYLTVKGATSGRHNNPLQSPEFSYIPADKDTVKDYGCGGDGGHGGGGGAGASTVVVHKFATNQANSKEVTAIARRHGYGSGGGKGGKGGDGCILVYY